MNSGVKAVIGAVVLFTLLLAALVAWRGYQKPGKGGHEEAAAGDVAPLTVDTATIETRTVNSAVHVTGEVESPAVVELTAKVGGILESIQTDDGRPLKEGDAVRAGDRVATIEHSQLDAMVAQAEAAQRVASAAVEQAVVAEAHMKKERDRAENLLKDGSATAQQRDQALAAHESAAAAVRLAKSQQEQTEATARLARLNQADAFVVSPINGMLTTKYVDEGNLVGPGRPLLRISREDVMTVCGELAETHIPFLTPGRTAAEITVDSHPGMTLTGVVAIVRPDVSRMTRTVRIEVSVQNPAGLLKPGMFARLRVFTRGRADVPAVPDAAIATDVAGSTFVYVVRNGTARRQTVALGIGDGTFHEVISGLQSGDVVVIRGKEALADGTKVAVPAEKPR
ncbi:MAG: efflux RND transporter periplasmic adaptor subunit [bacterium]